MNNWGDSSTEFRGNKSHPEFLRHSEPLRDLIFLSIFLHGGEFQDCIQDWSDWYLWIMGLEDIFPGSAHCDWQVSRPLAHPRMGISAWMPSMSPYEKTDWWPFLWKVEYYESWTGTVLSTCTVSFKFAKADEKQPLVSGITPRCQGVLRVGTRSNGCRK